MIGVNIADAIRTLDHMRIMTEDQKSAVEQVKIACNTGCHLGHPGLISTYETAFNLEIDEVVSVTIVKSELSAILKTWDGLVIAWCGRHCYGHKVLRKNSHTLKETLTHWANKLLK